MAAHGTRRDNRRTVEDEQAQMETAGLPPFPQWIAGGSYGGFAWSLVAAISLAVYAQIRRRGTHRQVTRAIIVVLASSALSLLPVWWVGSRLDVYGPLVSWAEVVAVLTASALFGWVVPTAALARFVVRGRPTAIRAAASLPSRVATGSGEASALDDPARRHAPLGDERPWGRLVALNGQFEGRPILLTHELTLIGREIDNDVILDDERASRHHAEIRWDAGHPQLLDRGSMNGTFINALAARGLLLLRDGDVIEVGMQRFRFERLPVSESDTTESAATDALAATASESGEVETAKIAGISRPRAVPYTLLLAALGDRLGEHTWRVESPLAVIGRDATCEVHIPDASISRRHAQIVWQSGGFYVADLGSSNGTLLNDAPLLAPVRIEPGDVLQVGEVRLRCGDPASTNAVSAEQQVTPVVSGED